MIRKILRTNSVNLWCIFGFAYVFVISSALVDLVRDQALTWPHLGNALSIGFLGGLYGILGFGFFFWVYFLVVITLLDVLLFSFSKKAGVNLITECLLLIGPVLYVGFQYSKWILIAASAGLIYGQLRRWPKIKNLLSAEKLAP